MSQSPAGTRATGHGTTQQSSSLVINRQVVLILITVFLNIMGLGLILPVMPFYALAFGADGEQIGLLFTAFSGCQFLASPVFGALSDRFGRRPIILIGVLGQAAAYVIMGLAGSLAVLFASRIFSGLTAGNISATQAYVADSTRPEDRTKAYGLVGAAFGAGLLFGPALGGLLVFIDPRAPAFGAAALLGLNFVFGLFMLSESLPRERRAPKPLGQQLNPVGVLIPLLKRPPLRGPLLATLLLNVALTGFQANFAVFAGARFGFGPADVSALFVATGLANILVQLLILPRLSKRFGDTSLVVTGSVLNAAGNLGTAFSPYSAALWGTLPVLTGGYSLSRGPLTSLVTKLVAPYEQGLANGGVQATISLAGVIGPLWAGFAFERLGEPAPYWTSAIAIGLAALAVMGLRARPATVGAPAMPAAAAAGSSLIRNGHTAPPQVSFVPLVSESLPAATLQGSLASLGLQPVLRFLCSIDKTGNVVLSRDGWTGRLSLNAGRVISASFGSERGLAALDAILLVLSEANFVFAEETSPSNSSEDFAIEVEELSSRPPMRLAQERGMIPLIPAPAAVPRLSELTEYWSDHAELKLRVSTLRTLLSVNGQRTIEELGESGGAAAVLIELATLMNLGLVSFQAEPSRSAQVVA
jgi:MFS family permease